MDYQPADEYFVVNDNDVDLTPIAINLPKPPALELIDGYGLEPKQQKWKRPTMPYRLTTLIKEAERKLLDKERSNAVFRATGQMLIDAIWDRLEEKKMNYEEEIQWIKKQWWYLLNGYWFFVNGKPTYVCGWHYLFLAFWYMDEAKVKIPEYRDRDRRAFLFYWYTYKTKESFLEISESGVPLRDERGQILTYNIGHRVSYGYLQPKNRRGGATNHALVIIYWLSLFNSGSLNGIISFNGDNAEEHFLKKLIPAWQHLPFFLRPLWEGNNVPKSELSNRIITGSIGRHQLGSSINYADSAQGSAYDGKKVNGIVVDEAGKTILCDVMKRHEILRPCLAQGSGSVIDGYMCMPSTVEEMEEGGGSEYYNIAEDSKFYERNPLTGQTKSGLFRLYFPAYDGLEGFVGPYGESIIEKPTPEQAAFIKRNIGAKEFLLSARDELMKAGTPEAKVKLRKLVEQYPISYEECFRLKAGAVGFDVEIIDKSIAEIRRNNNRDFIRGNFEWENGVEDSRVIFNETSKGRWEITRLFGEESNLFTYDYIVDPITNEMREARMPLRPGRFTIGADAAKFSSKQEAKINNSGDKMSDFGMVVLWEHDSSVDGEGKNISDWESFQVVAAYRHRPANDDDFAEDVIKTAVWYGSSVYPEMNINLVYKHFIKRGYQGYLAYDIDPVTGHPKEEPGYHVGTASKQRGFMLARRFIDYRGHKLRTPLLLGELKSIKSIEELTKYDTIAAFIAALMGSDSGYSKAMQTMAEGATINLDELAGVF